MPSPVDVDGALDARAHPLRALIDAIRGAVAAVDPRIVEQWKWNAPSFSFAGTALLTLMLRDDDRVLLVVHHPAAPEVESPLVIEAKADGRRMMAFRTVAEFAPRRDEFARYVAELVARTP